VRSSLCPCSHDQRSLHASHIHQDESEFGRMRPRSLERASCWRWHACMRRAVPTSARFTRGRRWSGVDA